MQRLSKKESDQRESLATALDSKQEKLEAAIRAFNEARESLWGKVEDAIAEYNAAVEQAQEFRADIESAQDDYMSDKSEKWTEGEKGEAYSAWKDEWGIEFEELEIEASEELEAPEMEHAQLLRDLPDEPNA